MDFTANEKKVRDSLKVAKLHYEAGLGQVEIAKEMAISRPTVSRLLKYAQENGLVEIKVIDPFESMASVEELLREKYGLAEAHVVISQTEDQEALMRTLGKYGAKYLMEIVKPNDTIGISWGKTINAVAQALEETVIDNVSVVELKGNVTYTPIPIYGEKILRKFGEAFNTTPYDLPLPVIFDDQTTHNIVVGDRHIRSLIKKGRDANIAIFTVGTVKDDALLFQTGYFDAKEQALIQSRAVGDICSRFYTSEGEIACPEINDRTVGIKLAELKKKEKAILVAGGQRKYEAIKGALAGGFTNCLITDDHTAKALVEEALAKEDK